MKKIVILYLLLVVAVVLGLHLNKEPGYVLIALGNWSIETSLWFALASLFVAIGVLFILYRIVKRVGSLKYYWYRFWQKRRTKRSQSKTRQGLIAFSEGNWQKAESNLIKALPSSETPLINYIVAARSAQEQGSNKRRDRYLREAQKSIPEAKIAILLTQAQLQLANQQWEQARAALNHLYTLVPKHPHVLKLMVSLYLELHDWPQLSLILPKLRRYKIISEAKLDAIELSVYEGLLKEAAKTETVAELYKCWQTIPKASQSKANLVYLFSKSLLDKNEHSHAESILRQTLKTSWDDRLIALYGKTRSHDLNKQLKLAESMIKHHKENPALYLCLGRICINLQLWGKAKSYLEYCVQLEQSPEAYNLLAKLLEQLDDMSMAQSYYKKGLEALEDKR